MGFRELNFYNFYMRLVTSLVLLFLLVAIFGWFSYRWVEAVVIFLWFLLLVEWTHLVPIKKGPLWWLVAGAVFLIFGVPILVPLFGAPWILLAIGTALFLPLWVLSERSVFLWLFGLGYLLVTAIALLRYFQFFGSGALLRFWAVVITVDVGAYFVGKIFRGPKIWPKVSPGKTWSGFFGGVVLATVVGGISLFAIMGWLSWPFSFLLSLISQGGDLGESWFKRRVNRKDSGNLLPGHGGFLDRLDGFLAACVLLGFWMVLS